MKLQPQEKANLLDAAKKVYAAYTALDFFKSRELTTQSGQSTLYELCQKAIAEKKYTQPVILNGVHFQLDLTPSKDNSYSVRFSRLMKGQSEVQTKSLKQYSDAEVLVLFTQQEFILQGNNHNTELSVANKLGRHHVIGGLGKIDLYRTHLVTLYHIIAKLEAEEDLSGLLVALATGSGKTFVQALWMLVLSVSGNNGVFAVPDKLAPQFTSELKRLLPDAFVDSMLVLRETGSHPQAHLALKNLKKPETKGQIIIAASEYLLDEHYSDLEEAPSSRTFLSFDEQHLLMKTERHRVRLIELAKQKLAMFLTATPNQETYDLAGHKPVAIMSSGQKQEAGQGLFPRIAQFEAISVSDRNDLKDYRFWTLPFWKTIANKILLALNSSIQEQHSSPAASVLDDLFYYHFDKEGESNVRWRMQVPVARKMLCIIDDNETLVNFCHALQRHNTADRNVYKNGNIIDRSDVADFFSLPDADRDVVEADSEYRKEQYQNSLQGDERAVDISRYSRTLKAQLKHTIFHNMMEYILSDITELDEIQHNQLRKNNFDTLQALVLKNFTPRTAAYYQEKLAKEIDPEGAAEIGALLAVISLELGGLIRKNDEHSLKKFIDNWALDDEVIGTMQQNNFKLRYDFDSYAAKHLMMGVMTGMAKEETAVAESRPFSQLTEQRRSIYDGNGALAEGAKKRKHTSLELLNDTSREATFTPEYLNITEKVADNYFRLGFIGMYVSNKKTEGFSDRNLHTVINIAEHTLATTNSPETQIQAIGRNRGLDATVEPVYIHATGRKQKATFDLNHLKSADYYPELFKAQKKYNTDFVQILGDNVSKQITQWVYAHVDDDETINPERLKRQVLKFIAQALRDINNKNSHQMKLSRAQLGGIVSYAMTGLNKEIANIKKPYRVSFTITALSYFLNFLSECYYSIKRIPAAAKIYYHSWFGKRTAALPTEGGRHADDVYIKIIQKTSFKELTAQTASFMELGQWIAQTVKGIKTKESKSGSEFFTAKTQDIFLHHQKELLEPLLVHCVAPSKQKVVMDALAAYPHTFKLLRARLPLLPRLFHDDTMDASLFNQQVLSLLQEIPGLHTLQSADIVYYPAKVKETLSLFSNSPLALLSQSKSLQESASVRLALYLQHDFAKKLSAFMTYPQAMMLQKLLNKDNNAALFVAHCFKQLAAGQELSPQLVLHELKHFFKLDSLKTLDEELVATATDLSGIYQQISDNLLACIDETHLNKVIQVIHQQLIPLLVNLYPLDVRAQLIAETTEAKIKQLLLAQGASIATWPSLGAARLAELVFSNAHREALPEQLDPEQERVEATRYIQEQFEKIKNQGIVNLFLGKLWAPSSWSLTPNYLYDAAIAHFLQSDGFLNAISLMLPHDQWLNLQKNVRANYSTLISIAREMIDQMVAGNDANLSSPLALLTLFNKHFKTSYQLANEAQQQVAITLADTINAISNSPIEHLSVAMNDRLASVGSKQVLPLLASYLQDDKKKHDFLNTLTNHEVIRHFIVQNAAQIEALQAKSTEELLPHALTLINQLVPAANAYALSDLHNPITNAQQVGNHVARDMQQKIAIAFLSGAEFREALKQSFNDEDYKALLRVLSMDNNIQALAKHLVAAEGMAELNKDAVLTVLKKQHPSLAQIKPLDERVKEFQDAYRAIEDDLESHLDKAKTSSQMADSLAPVLFHKRFAQTMNKILGFLNEQDLLVLFHALGKKDPTAEVAELLRFMSIIKKQDKAALAKEFLWLHKEDDKSEMKVRFHHVLNNIRDLGEEVLRCQCYYNQQNRTGNMENIEPALCSYLSSNLADARVSVDHYSFFNGFSRKVFYIHGITNGLSAAGKINAAANAHKADILQRVNSHILRPLWWSSNLSNAMHGFIKGCRDIAHRCVDAWYDFINTMKKALNWVTRSSYFTLSEKNKDSVDFNDTAFDFTHAINNLIPLDGEKAKQEDCPVDVITQVEDFVAKRPPSPGFFAANLGRTKVEDEVEKPSSTPLNR